MVITKAILLMKSTAQFVKKISEVIDNTLEIYHDIYHIFIRIG